MGLLRARPVCCAVVAGATGRPCHAVLIAACSILSAGTKITASVACVREVSQAGERSDKQARSGAAPVRREARAKITKRSTQKMEMKFFIVPDTLTQDNMRIYNKTIDHGITA